MLLRNELLGADCSSPKHERNENGDRVRAGTASARGGGGGRGATPPNLFRFRTALDTMNEDPRSVYDLSPVGEQSQRMLLSPRKAKRKIPKVCGHTMGGLAGSLFKLVRSSQLTRPLQGQVVRGSIGHTLLAPPL